MTKIVIYEGPEEVEEVVRLRLVTLSNGDPVIEAVDEDGVFQKRIARFTPDALVLLGHATVPGLPTDDGGHIVVRRV